MGRRRTKSGFERARSYRVCRKLEKGGGKVEEGGTAWFEKEGVGFEQAVVIGTYDVRITIPDLGKGWRTRMIHAVL